MSRLKTNTSDTRPTVRRLNGFNLLRNRWQHLHIFSSEPTIVVKKHISVAGGIGRRSHCKTEEVCRQTNSMKDIKTVGFKRKIKDNDECEECRQWDKQQDSHRLTISRQMGSNVRQEQSKNVHSRHGWVNRWWDEYMIWVTTLYSDVVMTRIAVRISICIQTHCMSVCVLSVCHLVPAKACVSDASPHWEPHWEPIQKRVKQISFANRNHIPRPFGWELTNQLETRGLANAEAGRAAKPSGQEANWPVSPAHTSLHHRHRWPS